MRYKIVSFNSAELLVSLVIMSSTVDARQEEVLTTTANQSLNQTVNTKVDAPTTKEQLEKKVTDESNKEQAKIDTKKIDDTPVSKSKTPDDNFVPSEEISEDLAVSFPVDI